jgi:putative aldouronate transport system substrate-binding protein
MKKRKLYLVLLAVSILSVLGCSKKADESGAVNQGAGSLVEIKVAEIPLGGDMGEINRIVGKVNEITKKKINTAVNYQLIDETIYPDQITLMVSGGEQLDLMFSASWLNLFTQIASGQLIDLTPYLQYMPEATKAVGMDKITPFAVNGKIYGIPCIRDLAQSFGYVVRKDIADKYGINESIKTYEELTPYFEKIVKGEGIPAIAYESVGDSILQAWQRTLCDGLGDYTGVLMGYTGNKVVNLFATEEYRKFAELVYKWNQMGAVPKDLSTSTIVPESMVRSGIVAGYAGILKPGYAEKTKNIIGQEVYVLELTEPVAWSDSVVNVMYSIPVTSKYPERAAMYINLLYSDPDIINLLTYGEEGIDYIINSEGIAEFPPGITPDTAKYNPGWGWLIGNQYLSHVFAPDTKDIWERLEAFNNNARKSSAYGFMFDPTNVATELASVGNVRKQYENAVGNGDFNPNDIIPRFVRDLEAAGMNKIIAEKQKQLDAWLAAKK